VVVPSTSVRPRLPASCPAARLIASPLPGLNVHEEHFKSGPIFRLTRTSPASGFLLKRRSTRPALPTGPSPNQAMVSRNTVISDGAPKRLGGPQ
jgi:hypothetical protein